jgi:hypothetical protein
MQGGRVTLIADNVPVRQILQEWARVGQTKIVNVERLSGPNLTLQLVNTPERDALDIILRSASGYIAAPRPAPIANAATYDRITIFISTARPPAQVVSAAPVPTFQRPPQLDDGDEPTISAAPSPVVNPQYPGLPPGVPPQVMPQQPFQQQPGMSPTPGPLTAPRPGALPTQPGVVPNAAPAGVPNPYQPPMPRPGGGGPGGL